METDLRWVCPNCQADLGDWVARGAPEFRCGGCNTNYCCRDGVFEFVPGDAYLESFSFEWQQHRLTFASDEARRGTENTLRKLHLTPQAVRGRRVLDVGCGAGRFSEVLSRWGAEVVAVDLSDAVYTARANLAGISAVTFARADLFHLPFPPHSFDVILAWGVLHHTPDTAAAFKRVVRHLRPGGTMAVYVYGRSKGSRRRMMDFYRRFTIHLPRRLLYGICLLAAPLHYVYKIPLVGNVLRTLFPVSRQSDWRMRVLETFDEYSPRYAWRHTFPEVHQWFVEAGMIDNRIYDPPIYAVGWLPDIVQPSAAPGEGGLETRSSPIPKPT